MSKFHFVEETALRQPIGRALALRCWSIEQEVWSTAQRASGAGYIAQEIERLFEDAT